MKRLTVAGGLAVLAAFLTGAINTLAQTTPPTAFMETYDAWTVSCVNAEQAEGKAARICQMSQQHALPATNKRVLTIGLNAPAADGSMQGSIVAPFGILLASGVSLAIDEGKTKVFGFRTCLPTGCVAPIIFDTSEIEALKAGNKLTAVMEAHDTAQPFQLEVSLAGFTAALSRLASARADGL